MTIKDIAKESGYSIGTVSRVLNNASDVSEHAKNSVMQVVNKYNFRLNNNAKHLKQQSKDGIAIIIKGTQNMLFAAVLEPMQRLVESKGYASLMYYISEDDNEIEQAIQICKERRPLGILFLGCNHDYFRKYFHRITVPCVLVTSNAEGLQLDNLSSVCTDDKSAARLAVEHLIEQGHKNIGVLGGNMSASNAVYSRYVGVKEALVEHGYGFDEDRQFVTSYFTISGGYEAMNRLFDKMPELTAVFAMSDVTAIGAIRAIWDKGLSVPEDISVVGFDGIDIGNYFKPRLTTIRQHKEKIAARSVEILLDCIDNGARSVYEVEEFALVKGESVRKIN